MDQPPHTPNETTRNGWSDPEMSLKGFNVQPSECIAYSAREFLSFEAFF